MILSENNIEKFFNTLIKIVEEKDFFNRQSDCCDTDGGNS